MPKILCLHGHGTSASIFKSQTAAFRSRLPPSCTFDFVSAPHPSAPAPGIKAIYPGSPTYTWYREPTPAGLREAHTWVLEYVKKNGPYEAVMGFSQGCSLVATMALYCAFDGRSGDAHGDGHGDGYGFPFRAAVFICGGVPLYALRDMGLDVSDRAEEINKETGALLNGTAGKLSTLAADTTLIKRGVGLWDGNGAALIHDPDPVNRPRREDVFGLDFTAFPEWARIQIPTVHVYGCKDPRWPAGIQLAEFCPDRVEFDHGGGHDIPRLSGVSERIAELVKRVVERV
ncbi:uncharacterized protein APUU_22002S [Aspergillus puulaauensis]|uniref:Serine hydrolase domain-containing protein n=1 Tax=Aspergillus puulaauensis TaxID=1220207 RepID=A0A7R7XHT8_9EURO|nr:uncharacterized protein APUU_22002S [Aspergillus puulaauensis]BCS21570.1 hypothetical protein APUU_22002S [Aspergillus puulaauensis]